VHVQNLLDRLCRDIETDLRLHIHSHLAVSERDPWKNGLQVRPALIIPRLLLFSSVALIPASVLLVPSTTQGPRLACPIATPPRV